MALNEYQIINSEHDLDFDAKRIKSVGNNVKLASAIDFVVTAGTTGIVFSGGINVKDYVYLYVVIKADTDHSYVVKQEIEQITLVDLENKMTLTNLVFYTDPYRPVKEKTNIRILNEDTVDHTYTIELYGLTS